MMPENDHPPLPDVTPTMLPVRSAWQSPWFLLTLAVLLLAGWQWLETRQRLLEIQQEVSRRVADGDASSKEAQGALKAMREQVDSLQAKLGAVDGKLTEFQGQTTALQTLYQELARSREEATLLEVEQAITLASQQLQLASNVPVALLALQTADARLARLERPQYLPLRKALAKDIARLGALPVADTAGISLRLEQAIGLIDQLPLLSYGRPRPEGSISGVQESAEKKVAADPLPWWQQTAGAVWLELKSLVRIQRFDREEPMLLAPGQAFFLRENLKLRLLNARLALLSRDQWTFRTEAKQAQEWLGRYFVADDKAVQSVVASLRQIATAEISIELPNLNDSHAALRSLRQGKEKR